MAAMTDVTKTAQLYLSREEASGRLRGLGAADHYRLERIARGRAFGLTMDWEDLLQETFARVISGSRRCPDDIEFMAFLAQTIRSVANEERRRQYASPSISTAEPEDASTGLPVAIVDHTTDVEGEVHAHRLLDRVFQHFSHDEAVTTLLQAYILGETASETTSRTGLSALDYDAARKRFKRGMDSLLNEKGTEK